MKVYYMKEKALDALQKDINNNLEKYQSSSCWVDQYFIDKEANKYFFDTGIDIPDYELIVGGPDTDFQNAKIIFDAFKDKLNPVQASDLRLWAYLAHVQHWDYMHNRWKIDVPDEQESPDDGKKSLRDKMLDRAKARYFYGNSRGKAFVRHGIARLYWGAYLTYDESNENPYELTEFLFSDQDVFVSIGERSYGRNKTITLAALKELKKRPDLSRDDKRLFFSKLNQAGAITVLDFLNDFQATQLCEKVMSEVDQIPTIHEGCTFKVYNNVTGKVYEHELKIVKGKTAIPGKLLPTNISPKNLIGKKAGTEISIGGQAYVIRDIKPA